jgi:hypothetical protein
MKVLQNLTGTAESSRERCVIWITETSTEVKTTFKNAKIKREVAKISRKNAGLHLSIHLKEICKKAAQV